MYKYCNPSIAMSIYFKLYGKGKQVDNISAQSAHLVTKENWCRHPACRGKNKFANHLWDVCSKNRNSPHYKQRASNKQYVKAEHSKQPYQKSRSSHTSKPDSNKTASAIWHKLNN